MYRQRKFTALHQLVTSLGLLQLYTIIIHPVVTQKHKNALSLYFLLAPLLLLIDHKQTNRLILSCIHAVLWLICSCFIFLIFPMHQVEEISSYCICRLELSVLL